MIHEQTTWFEWQSPEYTYVHNSVDWFWYVGIAGVLGVGLSIWTQNYLFAFLILMSSMLIGLYARHKPKDILIQLSEAGISIDEEIISHSAIVRFWIMVDHHGLYRLLLSSKENGPAQIQLPIAEDIAPGQVREFLLNYIQEDQMRLDFFDTITEKLGY